MRWRVSRPAGLASRLAGRGAGPARPRGSSRLARLGAGGRSRRFEVGEHVALGDAAAGTGGGDLGDVDPLPRRPSGRTAGESGPSVPRGAEPRAGSPAAFAVAPAARPVPACRVAGVAGRVDRADRRADRRPSRLPRRRSSRRPEPGAGTTLLALSVSSSKSGSPGLHERAVGLEPAREDPLGDRFAHARDRDRQRSPWFQLTPRRARPGRRVLAARRGRDQVRHGRAAHGRLDQLACSRSWTSFEPVAGLALASRPDVLDALAHQLLRAAATRTSRHPCSATLPAPRPTPAADLYRSTTLLELLGRPGIELLDAHDRDLALAADARRAWATRS